MPPAPCLHRKRAAAALSQAGRAGPDEPIRTIPAGRPAGRTGPTYATDVVRQTDVRRQHHRLMPPPTGRGHYNQLHYFIININIIIECF